jgi:tetratricopeptide (TPR) repeat protein
MGIFDFLKSDSNDKKPSIDLTDYKFLSDDHTRIQNGQATNADNKGAWRGIRVTTSDNSTFYVTMYNMNGNHPVWGDNIQMAEKQMKMLEETGEKIVLRGFGNDAMGSSFADYGLTLHKTNDNINKVSLHMHDRNIDIVYKKADNKEQANKLESFSKTDIFENFAQKFASMSMADKMQIAMQTDTINNRGADAYTNGNIEVAIENFKQALKIMPINDDALINLARCYTKMGEYEKSIEPLNNLYKLNPNTKSKIIGYSLLMHLLEDFDSDGGAVSPSTLINFIKDKFGVSTNDSEIKTILQRINEPYNRDILVYMLGGFGFGMGSGESPYMTSEGTTKSVIRDEIRDVLNWN